MKTSGEGNCGDIRQSGSSWFLTMQTGRGTLRGTIDILLLLGVKAVERWDCVGHRRPCAIVWNFYPMRPYPRGSNCICSWERRTEYHCTQLSIQAALVSHLAVSYWSVWVVLIVIINRCWHKFSETSWSLVTICCHFFSWYFVHSTHHSSMTADATPSNTWGLYSQSRLSWHNFVLKACFGIVT